MKKTLLSILIGSILIGGIYMFCIKDSKEKSLNFKNEINYKSDVSVGDSKPRLIKGKFIYCDEKGNQIEIPMSVEDIDPYSKYVELMLKQFNNHPTIKIPEGTRVERTNINTGTLTVNFNSDSLNFKFKNDVEQKFFVENLVKSLLSIEGKNYTDVQFMIDGSITERAFGGYYDTSAPLKR